jgi:putative mRNA 3-end processing factor
MMTEKGLFCPAGNFYIDPKGAVENAVITHAHSDHARRGSKHYYCTDSGTSLLKTRLGKKITVTSFPYGVTFSLGLVEISFHPAGHILGSAQVRIQFSNEVWVVSGDYKRDPDPTCAAFEPVKCDVFVSEATFGTPAFAWNKSANVGKQIMDWWSQNAANEMNSVLFAYSLGKAQRILGLLAPLTKDIIYCDQATTQLNDCYRSQQISLAPTICISTLTQHEPIVGKLFIVPPSFLQSKQACILGQRYKTAFASGWMMRRSNRFDQGFLLSDHADWQDLVSTILETGAQRVYVQHRGKGALVRHLKKLGVQAYSDADLYPKNPAQMVMF